MKTVAMTLGTMIAMAVLVGLTVIYAGLFNVSTSWKDPALVRWVLNTTRENAVKSRAASIDVPPMKGPKQVEEGFRSFREMCASCHTPPDAEVSPVTKGLNPEPPDLAKRAKRMTAAELFWVIKNGIRMTGMPAWGPTHEDDEIWNIVAFVKALPDMSGDDYRILDRKVPKGHGHSEENIDEENQSSNQHNDEVGGHQDTNENEPEKIFH